MNSSIKNAKKIVFLTVYRLIDFFKDDEHLLHTISFAEGRKLLIELERSLPSFLYNGRQDELLRILMNLVKITIGLKQHDKLNFQIKRLLELFAERESIYMSLGQRDHWLHVILVNLFSHLLAELNVNNFPPGHGEKAIVGGEYPRGEIIGKNLPSPKGFFENKVYSSFYTRNLSKEKADIPLKNGVKKQGDLTDVVNRYFFDWSLTLASLFHDCAYPLSIKLTDQFQKEVKESLFAYQDTFKGKVRFKPLPVFILEPEEDTFKTSEFEHFSELLQKFYFCDQKRTCNITKDYIEKRAKEGAHDILSALFVYLIKDELLGTEIREEEDFKRNVHIKKEHKEHLVRDLKKFYLDMAIHAIAFHHAQIEIEWEWNPVLFLLRLADVSCSFARPEIEKLRGRRVSIEGVMFGIDGKESGENYSGEIRIFLGYDYRNKFLTKEETKEAENEILQQIWEKELKDGVPNLKKPEWMTIETQLLGKFKEFP